MKYYLIEDILSANRDVYGYKGEVVTIIGDHDNCFTVQSETGKKFGLNKSRLSIEKINKENKNKTKKND